jgi:biopolymer transport protein ExbD
MSVGQSKAMSRLQGKKAIRSFARKMADPETIKDLNITPMMDMMTIILVFLLKSFTSSSTLIQLDANLQVPPSNTQLKPKEAVPLTITKKVVLVEGTPVVPVSNGRVDPAHKPQGENGFLIEPIRAKLDEIAKREMRVAERMGHKFDGELMVVADKGTPYRLLTEVLYSCGQAGYANYRLLVLKQGD